MNDKDIKDQADKLVAMGWQLTWGVSVPIVLFIIGLFIMPAGLILWVIAVMMFLIINAKTIENYADTKRARDEKN